MAQAIQDVEMLAATAALAEEDTPLTAKELKKKQQKKLKGRKGKQAATTGDEDLDGAGTAKAPAEKIPTWTALTHHLTPRPVLYSPDGRFAFVASGAAIKIYDAVAGTLVSSLIAPPEPPGKNAPPRALRRDLSVTCLRFNPQNSLQLISGALDGYLRFWDYTNGIMLRSIFIGYQIQDIAAHPEAQDFVFVATVAQPAVALRKTVKDPDMINHESSVMRVQLKRGATPKRLLLSKDSMVQLGISNDGQFLLAASVTALHVLRIHNTYGGWVSFKVRSPVRCLAIHPSQPMFATGDIAGTVKVYRAFETAWWDAREKNKRERGGKKGYDALRPPISTHHWHARPVSDVSFTQNGAQILSGGEESVLVLWQLSNGSKDFLPRIGAPISSITCAPITQDSVTPEAAVALVDGRVVRISITEKRALADISSIRMDYTIEEPSRRRVKVDRPLTFQPSTNHVVCLSSHPSTIQFYNLATDSHVKDIEVCRSNRVARRDGSYMDPQRVEHVAFSSPEPSWMATFDSWQSLDWAFSSNLKFWHQSSSDPAFYYLVAVLSNPHGTSSVTAMAFPPAGTTDPRLITAAEDGSLKRWKYYPGDRALRQKAAWKCESEFRHRDKPALALAWSPDGSLFAVAHNDSVSLWLAETLTCLHTFHLPLETGRPNSLSFNGEGQNCLVAGCSHLTIGWSLLDFSELFMIDANSGTVPALPGASPVTIIDCPTRRKGKTSIMTAELGKTPSLKTINLEDRERPSIATFLPTTQSRGRELLLYATQEGDVFAPTEALAHSEATDLTAVQSASANGRKSKLSLFDEIFGAGKEVATTSRKLPTEEGYKAPPKGSTSAVLSQPAHVLPPLKQLWQKAILLPPPTQTNAQQSQSKGKQGGQKHKGKPSIAEAQVDASAMDLDEGDTLLDATQSETQTNTAELHRAPADIIASAAGRL